MTFTRCSRSVKVICERTKFTDSFVFDAMCVASGSKGHRTEFIPHDGAFTSGAGSDSFRQAWLLPLTHSLTCLLLGVQIPPVHPVFVVIFGGVQVRVQTPLLFSAQNTTGSKKKDKKQNKTKQGLYQVLHDAKTKEKFKVSLCETTGRNQE